MYRGLVGPASVSEHDDVTEHDIDDDSGLFTTVLSCLVISRLFLFKVSRVTDDSLPAHFLNACLNFVHQNFYLNSHFLTSVFVCMNLTSIIFLETYPEFCI